MADTALYLSNTLHHLFDIKERPERLVTFETFHQSDEETWPDQEKDKDKDIQRTPLKTIEILIGVYKDKDKEI